MRNTAGKGIREPEPSTPLALTSAYGGNEKYNV